MAEELHEYQKCSIVSLLSDSQGEQSVPTKKGNSFLTFRTSTILEEAQHIHDPDVKSLSSRILASAMEIKLLTERIGKVQDENLAELSVAKSELYCSLRLLEERRFLTAAIQQFLNTTERPQRENSPHFNVITQNMMKEDTNVIFRKKRLARQKVKALEEWYSAHPEKPHLDEALLLFLIEKTGLEKCQIRNWISNRRRKERDTSVSNDISTLISQTEDHGLEDVLSNSEKSPLTQSPE